MACLAHWRQKLRQKSRKTARLFLQDRDQDQMFTTKTKTKTSWSKTKTFIFVLEAPRNQDPGLEEYITGDNQCLWFSVLVIGNLITNVQVLLWWKEGSGFDNFYRWQSRGIELPTGVTIWRLGCAKYLLSWWVVAIASMIRYAGQGLHSIHTEAEKCFNLKLKISRPRSLGKPWKSPGKCNFVAWNFTVKIVWIKAANKSIFHTSIRCSVDV